LRGRVESSKPTWNRDMPILLTIMKPTSKAVRGPSAQAIIPRKLGEKL
jgi:hypothetical protein